RLYGRGAYDMKGALAAMMLAFADLHGELDGASLELLVVPDEERSEAGANCTEMLVREGLRADFVGCGGPTAMQVGGPAKGVLMLRAEVDGVAAHGSTPWLGESAVLRGIELFQGLAELPFAQESTPLFAHPSINLGRIAGGDAINKVPDLCRLDIDIRYLPGQDPARVLRQVRASGPWRGGGVVERPPADGDPPPPLGGVLLAAGTRDQPSAPAPGRGGAPHAGAPPPGPLPAL